MVDPPRTLRMGECIKMTRLSRRIVGICFAVCVVLILATFGSWRYAERRSRITLLEAKNSFEQSIASNLPLGSDKSRAVYFLDAHKMRYIELQSDQLSYKRSDPWYKGAVETIEAMTTTKTESLLYGCYIHLDLKFDDSSKLLGYRDSMSCSGPW